MNQYVGIYESWRGRSFFQGTHKILKSWLMVWTVLVIVAFLLKVSEQYSRFVITAWFFSTPVVLITYRFILRSILAKLYKLGKFTKKSAIYGTGSSSQQLKQALRNNSWLGYEIVGIYDEKPEEDQISNVCGGIKELLKHAKDGDLQTVYIALPMNRSDEIKELLNDLSDTTVAVRYVPDFFSLDLLHANLINICGIPVLNVYDTPLNDPGRALLKRLEDFILSFIILLLISPLMLVLAIGVKTSSPGPIFYRQTRVGWNGKNFEMLKFRSMPVDTEKNGVVWGNSKSKATNKFGAFIRKTSLDELPQFINVLKGNMSIVGPRPERDIFVNEFRKEIPRYMQKHLVKAGITGWAQVNGWRGDTDLNKRIEYDLFYIDNWSLWFDFKIIILTILKGLINKNAY
jgi:putative colanic acid biosynthesis UDP-glucose lipid carrier transferase